MGCFVHFVRIRGNSILTLLWSPNSPPRSPLIATCCSVFILLFFLSVVFSSLLFTFRNRNFFSKKSTIFQQQFLWYIFNQAKFIIFSYFFSLSASWFKMIQIVIIVLALIQEGEVDSIVKEAAQWSSPKSHAKTCATHFLYEKSLTPTDPHSFNPCTQNNSGISVY